MTTDATQPLYRNRGARRILRPHDGRKANLSSVLQLIWDAPGRTRPDLARRTGLTKVTISDLVSELMDRGLVEETGVAPSARPGKPASTLAIRDDAFDIIALDLSAPQAFLGAVVSLRGHIRSQVSMDVDSWTGDQARQAVMDLIQACVDQATRPILGIGIGSPGAVDETGTIRLAANLGWRRLGLQDEIQGRFLLPTSVQNDANAAVIAERAFAHGESNMMRVHVTRGVGAGILLGGTLVLGDSAAAGEIGHVIIERGGAQCACGKQGCLETWISLPALQGRIDADPTHRDDILAEAGRRLGMALAPVVAALDVPGIVLGGPSDLLGGTFLQATHDLVVERTQSEFRRTPSVRLSTLGNEAVLLGAVSLVLRTTLGVS